ncbi:tRNA pseudouridine(13) synthase TruD [Natronospirillum operosum]|uniref:tRNA pseudouridine(13) synthase TruD n=1 Tax=Natronospirillum operosum TaxID=2759953 RepID=A0A4Z0WIA3_9GAMM|nr:tRNA pseudouridine(13) synthase TruD [Natronospirillum operosum]TGG95143.1 tRNA pseudouridine(13) synthase TruD [Natronospirillum operosum]
MNAAETFNALPRALGPPLGSAVLRQEPADFVVTELLTPPPSAERGQQEHLWLLVEKTAANTGWVARQLAAWFKVRARAVSFAGRKDRHAVTRQWFSVHLPGLAAADPDPTWPQGEGFQVLDAAWSARKLRRGWHTGNRFQLRLRHWDPEPELLQARLQQIRSSGVPNYFGAQRFGQSFQPAATRLQWPEDREQRGFMISAARSHLFNNQLAERVATSTWSQAAPGDWVAWHGSAAGFLLTEPDARLHELLAVGELSPTAWLPGLVRDQRLAPTPAEQALLASWSVWIDQLVERRVECARRACRVVPAELAAWQEDGDWHLAFSLPPGSFATAVVHALCRVDSAAPLQPEQQTESSTGQRTA